MFNRFIAATVLALAAVFVVGGGIALAQDTNVAVGGLYATLRPYLADVIGLAIVAVIAYLSKMIKDRFGIEIEARHREALHSAAVTGVNKALASFDVKAGAITVDVKNKIVADALNYAIKAAPDAIQALGLSDRIRTLEQIIESKLQVALPDRPNA